MSAERVDDAKLKFLVERRTADAQAAGATPKP